MLGANPRGYAARFKGKYLYLERTNHARPTEICRLAWTGQVDAWEFAIYRHWRKFYDPNGRMFPGAQQVNGTAEGAMKAGMEAYPIGSNAGEESWKSAGTPGYRRRRIGRSRTGCEQGLEVALRLDQQGRAHLAKGNRQS